MERQAPTRMNDLAAHARFTAFKGLARKSAIALAVSSVVLSPLNAKAWFHGRDDDDHRGWHPHPFFHFFVQPHVYFPPPIYNPPPVYYNPPVYVNPPQYYVVPQPPPVIYQPSQPAQPPEHLLIPSPNVTPNSGTTQNGKFHTPKGCFAYPILNHTEYFVNCKGGVHFTVKAK